MSRDKQIEEIAKDLCNDIGVAIVIVSTKDDGTVNLASSGKYLKNLVDKGYRKTSDIAREIIGEIEKVNNLFCTTLGSVAIARTLAELKKKYTEGGE